MLLLNDELFVFWKVHHAGISKSRHLIKKSHETKNQHIEILLTKICILAHEISSLNQNMHFKTKNGIWKKHDALFEDLISYLKSVRKTKLEKVYFQTRYFQKNI